MTCDPAASGNTISWDMTFNLSDTTLAANQGDSVILGTLNFTALNAGSSSLTFNYVDLTGRTDPQTFLPVALSPTTTTQVGTVTVSGTVPEPTTFLLFGVGALGLGGKSTQQS